MQVHLHTLGCRLNEAELARWSRELRAAGHDVCAEANVADVIVVNTCSVTSDAARSSRRLTRRLHRARPEARIVLTGCFATLEAGPATELPGVDLLVPNSAKERLVELLLARYGPSEPPPTRPPSFARHPTARRRRAFVKVQDGCRNRCSFCVVTLARGAERSRPVPEVVAEVRQLVAAGQREVVVTGVHLGGYGSELGPGVDLTHLLRALLADTDVERLRVGSLEPWDLPPDFARLWADHPRLMPHLHLPAQSGSTSVLQRMRRRCRPDQYRALVSELRATCPSLLVSTDLIVGFPGETDAEHAETEALVDDVGFSDAHVFVWSPRAGTRAATLQGRVDRPTARARSAALHRQVAAQRAEVLAGRIGHSVRVLIEQVRPDAHGASVAMGYSEDYLPVRIPDAGSVPLGTVLAATVDAAHHDALWARSHGLVPGRARGGASPPA